MGPLGLAASVRAVDPRPARTRAAILGAIERLGKRDEEITIAAIVAEAEIARSSFYAQYRDLGDVAVQLIDALYVDITRQDRELRMAGRAADASEAAFRVIFDELTRRRSLYRAVLLTAASAEAVREICRIMADGAMPAVHCLAPAGLDHLVTARFIAAGVLTTLMLWLEDERFSEAEMIEQIVGQLPPWLREIPAATSEPSDQEEE